MEINSVEYWNDRFSRNWIQYRGHEQTEWFARLLLKNLPSFVADHIDFPGCHIVDFGCAFGECAALLKKRFQKSRVTGLDFSSVAIEEAGKAHGECEFVMHDMLQENYPCDVAVCSNVLEHFKDPTVPFLKLFTSALKYVVIMVPFERNDGIAEHQYTFTTEFFPLQIGEFSLQYSKVITSLDCDKWPGNQLLIVYGKDQRENLLVAGALSKIGASIEDRVSLCQKTVSGIDFRTSEIHEGMVSSQEESKRLRGEILLLHEEAGRHEEDLSAVRGEISGLVKAGIGYKGQLQAQLSGLMKAQQNALAQVQASAKRMDEISRLVNACVESQEAMVALLRGAEQKHAELFHFVNAILWRMKEAERVQSERCLRNRIMGLPFLGKSLLKIQRGIARYKKDGVVAATRHFFAKYTNRVKKPILAKDIVSREFKKGRYKGVYVIAGIPWDVPIFQRPQQMALAFLRKGYLVVYLEYVQNNPSGTVFSPMKGLWVITVDDFGAAMAGLKRCIISVYSTILCWRDLTKFTKEFARENHVVYEYIDHFDEKISGAATDSLRIFFDYLVKSDMPITYLASANFLLKELKEKTGKDVVYVANGVDVKHFSKENIAGIRARVQLPECLKSKKVKIGYFGALAPWLDYKLIGAAVCAKPEWEFVFIGPDYYDGASKLPKDAANCHWLGPIAYCDLPAYASCFDVAILPFQSGDLAKATSPLKLFEYFALGKPVVVTPDMFECTVYDEVFSGVGEGGFLSSLEKAVEKCSDASYKASLVRLAEDNTWDARAGQLIAGIRE